MSRSPVAESAVPVEAVKPRLLEGRDEPHKLGKNGFVEEDKMLVPGINVRAATIQQLAVLAVDCFGQSLLQPAAA